MRKTTWQQSKRPVFWRWVLGAWLALGVAGCSDSYSWHQKLEVEVDTPEGVVRGASVVKVWWSTGSDINYFPGATNAQSSVSGEATVVEVAEGRYLFALLDGAQSLAPKVFLDKKSRREGGVKLFGPMLQTTRKQITVPHSHYPTLVTFSDINDPTSVQKVDPDNLAATFGPGVSLKRLTLEITDEPVTEGKIESVLEWLDDPRVMKNPGWRNLPSFTQTSIYGLRTPVKPVK